MTDNWQRIGQSSTSPRSNTNRAVVSTKVPKTENIIFIGSEYNYDSFWLKNMFIAAAYLFVKDKAKFRICDKVTIAYVDYGYTRLEKLAIEGLANEINFQCEVEFIPVRVQKTVIDIFDNDRKNYKIQDLAFFCHGMNNVISLNFNNFPTIDLRSSQISLLNREAFLNSGTGYSYACRTGVSEDADEFSNLSSAQPSLSFAQKFANHNGVNFHAFYKRSLYRSIIHERNESASISKELRVRRSESGNLDFFNILDKYEALKHEGLGHTITIKAPIKIPNFFDLIPKGNVGEGVEDYSLWRKGGGMNLPTSGDTPTGLPSGIHIFKPQET